MDGHGRLYDSISGCYSRQKQFKLGVVSGMKKSDPPFRLLFHLTLMSLTSGPMMFSNAPAAEICRASFEVVFAVLFTVINTNVLYPCPSTSTIVQDLLSFRFFPALHLLIETDRERGPVANYRRLVLAGPTPAMTGKGC